METGGSSEKQEDTIGKVRYFADGMGNLGKTNDSRFAHALVGAGMKEVSWARFTWMKFKAMVGLN